MKTSTPNSYVRSGKWKAAFLQKLIETGNVSVSARIVGIEKATAYNHREADPEFRAAWAEAIDTAVDLLEHGARTRALEGTLEPVYQGGKKVGEIRRYSDRLMELLLKGHRPEKYAGQFKVEHSGPNGGAINVNFEKTLNQVYGVSTATNQEPPDC